MPYSEILTKPFLSDVKDIKKDKALLQRLERKMDEIMETPEHYPVKKHELKGKRAAHVGSYVLIFDIVGTNVIFLRFKHHDYAYG